MRQHLNAFPGRVLRATLALCALAAALTTAASPLRVAVISDMNGAYGSAQYSRAVAEAIDGIVSLRPDLVINTGDMVAGQRRHPPLQPGQAASMWAAFHGTVTDPLRAAGIPMAITPGNHDASAYAPFRAERARFAEEWSARRPGLDFVDGAGYPFDYAFALGEVLFVSLDVTTVGPLAQPRLDWLDALLAMQGPRFRHRVVFSHVPVYPFTQGRETEVSGDARLAALLTRHRVDIYLSGHHHAFYPGWHDGVLHVSQACLGAGPRRLIGSDRPSSRAVTWLEFEAGELRVSALQGPGLMQTVDIASLPRELRAGPVTLVRQDLRPRGAGTPVPQSLPGRGRAA